MSGDSPIISVLVIDVLLFCVSYRCSGVMFGRAVKIYFLIYIYG